MEDNRNTVKELKDALKESGIGAILENGVGQLERLLNMVEKNTENTSCLMSRYFNDEEKLKKITAAVDLFYELDGRLEFGVGFNEAYETIQKINKIVNGEEK